MPNATDSSARAEVRGVRAVEPRYANASAMGVALGFVLLASFVFAGRGIGASGAFAHVTGSLIDAAAPGFLASRPTLADRLPSGVDIWNDWIVWQIIGVCIGAAFSAKLAGRWGRTTRAMQPDDAQRRDTRVSAPLAGGVLMGIGARFAYGCTSGLALSGGALLATGAWLFIFVAFGTATLVAFVARSATRAQS